MNVNDNVYDCLETDRRHIQSQGRKDRRHLDLTPFDNLELYYRNSFDPTFDIVSHKMDIEKMNDCFIRSNFTFNEHMVRYYYYDIGLTMQEIADKLGVSKMAVSKMNKKIVNTLRGLMLS
ncbi:MAG: sigma factor-like helix-turn-helix DNA-binding protein [Eubacterium sp.]